ncbi:predicted protein [Histoplasma capsulatum G186AR]|uniref:Uncharacterized protein n=1 Tax=Ajellomyces capsulatus (strain G186AR / H82 / ATCC MYA-2454 / RMSCC 2432) TaxID=447093 RepID=C0NU68_AJECG|nr:uncharacterized protein HCBG_06899 [Histoplasma capsulatum G186AR]EEH04948.1 predicted protein [Histoplasma capsulatum G186AR]
MCIEKDIFFQEAEKSTSLKAPLDSKSFFPKATLPPHFLVMTLERPDAVRCQSSLHAVLLKTHARHGTLNLITKIFEILRTSPSCAVDGGGKRRRFHGYGQPAPFVITSSTEDLSGRQPT